LIKVNTSSYVQLNRCIAIFYANGAQKAIKEIEKLELEKTLSKYSLKSADKNFGTYQEYVR
jgi:predicted RNA polymerase sigma factor